MPLSKLVFKPGVNRDQTDYASEGSWYSMDKVRFRSGFPEKLGGWNVRSIQQYSGTCRSLFSYSTDTGVVITGVGTNEKIYILGGTNLTDITPLRVTYTHSTTPSTDNCINTTISSKTVTVNITSHGADTGAWVTFSGIVGTGSPAKIGGIPITEMNKEVQITVLNNNTFTFQATTTSTLSTTNQGGTAITAAFQINTGYANVTAGWGWGTGVWGRGTWGSSSSTPVFLPARLEFQDHFNNDLIFNIIYSYIYYWVYDTSFTNRAVLLSSISGAVAVPQQVTKVMFAPSGYLLALGCTTYDPLAAAPDYLGYYDPLLIRWANVDPDIGPQPEIWQPTTTNTAGFLRVQSGSGIVTGVRTRQEVLIFTNVSLSSLQYLGTAEVFALQELANNITIAGPNCVAVANNIVLWMGTNKFYSYSGRVDTLPCTLRQYIFQDINFSQSEIFFSGTNNQFNEIIWFYCSAASNEIDKYVIYNYSENIWYYGTINRTAWIDASYLPYPIAASTGWIYQHEDGNNDGQPLGAAPLPLASYIQSADVDIEDGDKYMLIRRIIPDVNFTNSETANPVTGTKIIPQATITVGVRNFPGAASSTTNAEGQTTNADVVTSSVTIDQYTNQVFIRARGRQMNFKISSDTVGVQWQLGMPRVDARPDGLRG
jgi:hypothetical protein